MPSPGLDAKSTNAAGYASAFLDLLVCSIQEKVKRDFAGRCARLRTSIFLYVSFSSAHAGPLTGSSSASTCASNKTVTVQQLVIAFAAVDCSGSVDMIRFVSFQISETSETWPWEGGEGTPTALLHMNYVPNSGYKKRLYYEAVSPTSEHGGDELLCSLIGDGHELGTAGSRNRLNTEEPGQRSGHKAS